MQIVAEHKVVDEIRSQGGSVYFWASKHCCGGTFKLDASTQPPDADFELIAAAPVQVFARPGARLPEELHLDLDRKSRIHAYWDGLAVF
ncbi:MAG: hypothetical protein ABI783_05590 [Actinomycetota bacterium]